ncbi:MAG: response regulator transcription factor [Sulfurospirillaceae bacterium]|nr:response regulator transcription factor [Sulfurospirillaceae bacterium]
MKQTTTLDLLSDKVVLYAEDEAGIRNVVVEILEFYFHKVIAVKDGEEALEQFAITPPDVLIFDICLPKTDGLAVIQNIRKNHKNIPVIILSAHAGHEYLWRAVELKITKYLVKPFKKEDLEEALKLCCEELSSHQKSVTLSDTVVYHASKKVAIVNQCECKLSKSESRLLEYMIDNKNKVISFESIEAYLWGYDGDEHSKEAIKALVKELRKKLGKEVIKNIYGLGYSLEL